MIGRWLSFLTTGIAEMSNVLRVAVSNVRMPRSHRMTSLLPPLSTYSADSSHSSIVAEMPRLSSTGFRACPSSRSSVKFCMLRAPTWKMSAYLLDHLDLADVHHLGDELQVLGRCRVAQQLQAFLAEALEAVRRAARLERAAAEDLRAGPPHGRGRGAHLLLGLGRAGPGHHDRPRRRRCGRRRR